MERSILLFEPDFPCWDEETFALAGEDPVFVKKLAQAEYIKPASDGFVLTEKGEELREKQAEENWLAAAPIPDFDASRALWNNRLYLLMERAFIGQFGVKEYSVDETLPVVPAISSNELFKIENGQVEYLWEKHPLIKSFIGEFPNSGVGARGITPPGQEALDAWTAKTKAPTGSLHTNLILRSRYDFELYRKEPQFKSDKYKMKDADRLFFFRVEENTTEDFYRDLGYLHLFMLAQKRIYIPGYGDIDSQDQENWTMAVVVADSEKSLEKISAEIATQGKALINPMPPLFIIGTSIERLKKQGKPKDTVYDWFCEDTVHITRPDI